MSRNAKLMSVDTETALRFTKMLMGEPFPAHLEGEDSQVYDAVVVSIDPPKPMTVEELAEAIRKVSSQKELSALVMLIPTKGTKGVSDKQIKELWKLQWCRTQELFALKHGLKIKGVTGEIK